MEGKGLENSRQYRMQEWKRYMRTRPLACWPVMKNYYQCFDHYRFDKNEDEGAAKAKCFEKFNYQECFDENKDKLRENWIFNREAAE
jgi:hypothetical protein